MMKPYLCKNRYGFINYDSYKYFWIFSFNSEVHSTKGNLGVPKLNPNILSAALTGIGFVSANKQLIKGKACNW